LGASEITTIEGRAATSACDCVLPVISLVSPKVANGTGFGIEAVRRIDDHNDIYGLGGLLPNAASVRLAKAVLQIADI
jgi:hypothetical protein